MTCLREPSNYAPRQRFLATARFQPVDRAFLLRPWLWTGTPDRWRQEGLPADSDPASHFRTHAEACVSRAMHSPYGPHLHPPLERRVLQETEAYVVV